MNKRDLFSAIDKCSDEWLEEMFDDREKKKETSLKKKKSHLPAAIFGVILVGMSATVAAANSSQFQQWIIKNFSNSRIVKIEDKQKGKEKRKKDTGKLCLQKDMAIAGETESFVYRYHEKADERIIDEVYKIGEDGLEKLEPKQFQGSYDGNSFSFSYVTIGEELFAYDQKGAAGEVFPSLKDDTAYASLYQAKGDIVTKECIAKLNLKTGTVTKLTDDNKICNYVMSPNGEKILCNYRDKEYWTVFDVNTKEEEKVPGIDGYNHTNEIKFLDDDHVLSLHMTYKKDGETTGTNLIDLRTQKVETYYDQYGEINVEWGYEQKGTDLLLYCVTGKEKMTIPNVKNSVHIISSRGDYVLLGNYEEPENFYLCNLAKKSYRKIKIPKGLDEIELYLTANGKQLLLLDETEGYFVDCP